MRPLLVRPRHEIQHIELSADGRWLATCQHHHGITVRSTADGAVVRALPPKQIGAYSARLVFHPSGSHLAVLVQFQGQQFSLVDLTDAQAGVRTWTSTRLVGVRFSDDGSAAECVGNRTVKRVSLHGPKEPADGLRTASSYITNSLGCLSADGRLFVSEIYQSDRRRRFVVRKCAGRMTIAELPIQGPPGGLAVPQFTPAGDRVITADGDGLAVYDIPAARPADRKPLTVRHSVRIEATQPQPGLFPIPVPFAILPCGTKLLMRGTKSRVELRCAFTGDVLTEWRWRMKHLTCLAVSADGTIAAAAGRHGEIVLWDLDD